MNFTIAVSGWSVRSSYRHLRRGLTLVEMLVAMALTLVLVYAVVQIFAWVGDATTKGRAMIELQGTMRNVVSLLQQDLDNATCFAIPNASDTGSSGYLELVEGPSTDEVEYTDYNAGISNQLLPVYLSNTAVTPHSYRGDHDDIICLTVRNSDVPYAARDLSGKLITSSLAEIVWWAKQNNPSDISDPRNLRCNIYRRALLIRPDLDLSGWTASGKTDPTTNTAIDSATEFESQYDISVRPDPANANKVIPNSLTDLSDRRNRVAHLRTGFPYETIADPKNAGKRLLWLPVGLSNIVLTGDRAGEDIVASNCLAFDMKVWDSKAALTAAGSVSDFAETPDDPGYKADAPAAPPPPPDPALVALANLQNQYHFAHHPADNGTILGGFFFPSYNNYGVKWIYQVSGGSTTAGFYIDSAGNLYRWTSDGATAPTGTLIANVGANVFADPNLLLNAQVPPPPPPTSAGTVGYGAWVNMGYDRHILTTGGVTNTVAVPDPYVADRALWNLQNQYHFAHHPADNGTILGGFFFPSYNNYGVKWIYQVSGGSTTAGFYIDSAGNLYQWTSDGATAPNGTFLANVGASVFSDPNKLLSFDGKPAPPGPPNPAFITTYLPKVMSTVSWFSNVPIDLATSNPNDASNKSQLLFPTYDTWDPHYNHNGVDESNSGASVSLSPYSSGEGDTTPPYAYCLRGVKVSIRLYEEGSRQVLQSSLVSQLVP